MADVTPADPALSPGGGSSFLSRKVMGIPVSWILIALALLLLYFAFRVKKADNVPASNSDEFEDDDFGGTSDSDQPIFVANPSPSLVSTVGSATGAFVEDTNEAWSKRAIEWLYGSGGATVSEATNAITKYLDESPLSQRETQLKDAAVKQFGLPPEGVIASTTSVYNGPASAQGKPPLTHTVRGTSDNSGAELALLYYGLNNMDAIVLIHSANTTMTDPYHVGAHVRIPAWRTPRYYHATSATRSLYQIAAKNGTTPAVVTALNPKMHFPVAVGTRVRVH